MSYQLKIDEILEGLVNCKHPCAEYHIKAVEAVTNVAARALAQKLDILWCEASFEGIGFGGTCAPFYQKYEGQPLPEAIEGFDNEEEWYE